MSGGEGGWGIPGSGTITETSESEILWGGDAGKGLAVWKSAVIQGETRDSGNTPTTLLRPGLVLGQLSADSHFTDYDPDASDGSEIATAILGTEIRAQDFNATDQDRVFRVLVAGPVKAAMLNGLDDQARVQLGPRFMFDDDLPGGHNFLGRALVSREVVTDTTLTAADNGKRIVCTTADCNITLPAIASNVGFKVEIVRASEHELVITSPEGNNILGPNDASATTATWTTATNQIGVVAQIEHIWVGTTTKWLLTYSGGFDPTMA